MTNTITRTIEINQTRVDTKKELFKANSVIATTTHLSDWIGSKTTEHLVVLALNTKNQVIGEYCAFIGSLNATVAQPREIIQFALLSNAARIILSHNHPSGNTEPSISDSKFTDRMTHACHLIGIDLLDHIIVSDDPVNYYSFKENHLI